LNLNRRGTGKGREALKKKGPRAGPPNFSLPDP